MLVNNSLVSSIENLFIAPWHPVRNAKRSFLSLPFVEFARQRYQFIPYLGHPALADVQKRFRRLLPFLPR